VDEIKSEIPQDMIGASCTFDDDGNCISCSA
jgi:hypothetical protein